jgi:hypothetical protein
MMLLRLFLTAGIALGLGAVALPTALAHGPAVYRPAGAGTFVAQAAPAPAPAPSPTPARSVGGGTTPRGGSVGGGTTPKSPRGGTTADRGQARFGNSRFAKSKTLVEGYLELAIKLPWEGSFLPSEERSGYDAGQVDIDDAVLGMGGADAWPLEDKPTLVFLYDPSRPEDLASAVRLDEDRDFCAAAAYFNLRRLDVRTIKSKKILKDYRTGGVIVVYDASGTRHSVLKGGAELYPRAILKALEPVIRKDFGRPGSVAIAQMESVRARKVMLTNQLRAQEGKLFDAGTGERDQDVSDRVNRIRRELRKLTADANELVTRSQD